MGAYAGRPYLMLKDIITEEVLTTRIKEATSLSLSLNQLMGSDTIAVQAHTVEVFDFTPGTLAQAPEWPSLNPPESKIWNALGFFVCHEDPTIIKGTLCHRAQIYCNPLLIHKETDTRYRYQPEKNRQELIFLLKSFDLGALFDAMIEVGHFYKPNPVIINAAEEAKARRQLLQERLIAEYRALRS
jgi:hypothetical protein